MLIIIYYYILNLLFYFIQSAVEISEKLRSELVLAILHVQNSNASPLREIHSDFCACVYRSCGHDKSSNRNNTVCNDLVVFAPPIIINV